MHKRSDIFAHFFDTKINSFIEDVVIDPNVYDGIKKMTATDCMFMSSIEIRKYYFRSFP